MMTGRDPGMGSTTAGVIGALATQPPVPRPSITHRRPACRPVIPDPSRKGRAGDLAAEPAFQAVPPVSDVVGDAAVLTARSGLRANQERLACHGRTKAVGDQAIGGVDL